MIEILRHQKRKFDLEKWKAERDGEKARWKPIRPDPFRQGRLDEG